MPLYVRPKRVISFHLFLGICRPMGGHVCIRQFLVESLATRRKSRRRLKFRNPCRRVPAVEFHFAEIIVRFSVTWTELNSSAEFFERPFLLPAGAKASPSARCTSGISGCNFSSAPRRSSPATIRPVLIIDSA